MTRITRWAVLFFFFLFVVRGIAADQTGKIILLHTNDIHDHLRAGDSGYGGIPYISAYVKQVRRQHDNTLLVDAGDVLEKGNMVSWVTRGRVMYEAMNRIGYDAGVPGNHDFAFGADQLSANMRTANFPLLCANPLLSEVTIRPSTIIKVDGVRVGLIGMTLFSGGQDKNIAILRSAAEQIENDSDLLIALCHLNSRTCRVLADAVPAIDVFVSGHAHEVLSQPIIAKKSGALIVQAGSLGRYIGHWELTVDLKKKKIARYQGRLVSLVHKSNPCDEEMVAWVREQEQEECPEAYRVVGETDKVIGGESLVRLFAQSLLQTTDGDVVLSHTSMLRGQIYPGPIQFDDIFMTYVPGRQRELIEVELTGEQLDKIMKAAKQNKGTMVMASRRAATDFASSKKYRTVLTRGNWAALQKQSNLGLRQVAAQALEVDLIESLADYLANGNATGSSNPGE